MKQKNWEYLVRGLGFGIIAILVLVFEIISYAQNKDYIKNKKTENLYDLIDSGKELKKGTIVDVDIDMIVDWYAKKTTTKSSRTISEENYCVAILNDDSIISLSVKDPKIQSQVDKLIKETWDLSDGTRDDFPESVTFVGRIEKLNKEATDYYNKALTNYNLTLENDYTNIYYLTINTNLGGFVEPITYVIGTLLALVFLVVAFFNLKYWKNSSKNDVAIMPTAYNSADQLRDTLYNTNSSFDNIGNISSPTDTGNNNNNNPFQS